MLSFTPCSETPDVQGPRMDVHQESVASTNSAKLLGGGHGTPLLIATHPQPLEPFPRAAIRLAFQTDDSRRSTTSPTIATSHRTRTKQLTGCSFAALYPNASSATAKHPHAKSEPTEKPISLRLGGLPPGHRFESRAPFVVLVLRSAGHAVSGARPSALIPKSLAPQALRLGGVHKPRLEATRVLHHSAATTALHMRRSRP